VEVLVKKLWVVLAVFAITFVVLMSPGFAAPGRRALVVRSTLALFLFAAIASLVVFWVLTIAELLRRGPGAQREWWLAALAVVVLLGPIGAIAYRLARPSFDEQQLDRDSYLN
jgi:uncharacterized membrane protein YhaH (DUF805 family)